jgi:hypothetical protein
LRYDGDLDAPFDDKPVPHRDTLPKRDFLTTAGFTATRGCRSRCEFCYLSTKGLRMPWRTRDPQAVAAEFAATGEPYGVFLDNNLSADPAYLRALCDALRPLRRIWSAAVTADVGDDPSHVGRCAIGSRSPVRAPALPGMWRSQQHSHCARPSKIIGSSAVGREGGPGLPQRRP